MTSRQAICDILKLFEIAPVNRSVLERAIESKIADFEDAVLEQAAYLIGADAIITRSTKGFRKSAIKAVDPVESPAGAHSPLLGECFLQIFLIHRPLAAA